MEDKLSMNSDRKKKGLSESEAIKKDESRQLKK